MKLSELNELRLTGPADAITSIYFVAQAARDDTWRQAAMLAVLVGLLGAVALATWVAPRRSASAYGRYLSASNVSDVFVNVSGRLCPACQRGIPSR